MPLSRKIKIISVTVILALLGFVIVCLFQNRKNQGLIELKKEFELKIEQAEELKMVQLDSARIYAYKAYEQVREDESLEFEKNVGILTLSEIEFLRLGASDRRYKKIEKCENWFREHKFYDETFRANWRPISIPRLGVRKFEHYL